MPAALRSPAFTLAEIAQERLRERIIGAAYLPGEFLQETVICADLGLGRTPVRQALQALQQEGLLDIIPRKGILVRPDTLSDMLLALETRLLVEPYCAGCCAEKATRGDIEAIEILHNDYTSNRSQDDRRRLMELDRQLHSMITFVAGNRLLHELLRPLHERMSRMWFLPQWKSQDFGATAEEHEKLIEAIRNGDRDRASAAMSAHLESLRARVLSGGAPVIIPTGR